MGKISIPIIILLLAVPVLSIATEYKYSNERSAVKRAIADGYNDDAIRLLIPFAENKDAYAQGSLGERYYSAGQYKLAMKWFNKAIKNGDVDSLYNIGAMYEKGNGVSPDFVKAYNFYVKAAKSDNLYALTRLGEITYNGIGNVQINKDKAINLWSKAANSNFIPAMKHMCKHAPRYMLSGPNKLYCTGE